MNTIRKGNEWFELLTPKEKKEFTENVKTQRGNSLGWIMQQQYGSFLSFLRSSFVWQYTEQGIDYWHDVATDDTRKPLIEENK